MNRAFIKHITEVFPKKKYSNENFFDDFPHLKKNEKSLLKVGVLNRFVVDENVTASDLCFEAANKFFFEADIKKENIDFLIFCSTEFDYYTPTSSAVLQNRLGLPKNIGAIDIVSSCTGFIHSLSLAKSFIESGISKNVLLLCASTLTKTFHVRDSNSKFLFGDAAAAVLLSSSIEKGIGDFVFGTDGSRADYIIVKDGGGRCPINDDSFVEKFSEYGNVVCNANFYMNGTGVFLFALKTVPVLVKDILMKNNTKFEDIDFFVFHQANVVLLKAIQKKLDIPDEKFIIEMEDYGNTVAVTIPIAIKKAIEKGKMKSGSVVLIAAFGTGLTWGGTILKI